MSSKRFLTASETAREIKVPVSQVLAAVEAGSLVPAGRAGSSKNAAILFLASDLPAIRAAIESGAAAAMRPHLCRSAGDVREKGEAFRRASSENHAMPVAQL